MLSEKCKIKQWDGPTHLFEWSKSEPWQMLASMRGRGILIHCWWDGKMLQLLWKIVWWLLTKFNIHLPNYSTNQATWYLPKGAEKWPHRNLHLDVYSSFIYNFQNSEATKITFSRWIRKKILVQLDTRILLYTLSIYLSMNI